MRAGSPDSEPSIGKVLLTGGTGFVGGAVRRALERRNLPCAWFSRSQFDLTSQEQADAAFELHADAELIVHLAGAGTAGDFTARAAADLFDVNHRIHVNVLRAWCRHLSGARMLAVGSSCAYPAGAARLNEDAILSGPPDPSVAAFAASKRALLAGLHAYDAQYGLDGSYIVPATLFGPHDDFDSDRAHVVSALIARFVRAKRTAASAVEIWGDGSQVRDFMHVDDFADALVHVAGRCHRTVLNVGPGRGTSVRELAELIRDAVGYSGRLVYDPNRYSGVPEKVLDTSRLTAQFTWAPHDDLAGAIARTVAWYEQSTPCPATT